ncbi:MAG: sulfatase [Candidatus Bathyarchaeota archaeon]|nr:MAG: sulfatase [Candidatus Bathyarchaeota archaeon]
MKNIILITVDCLRPDHLNCYGYDRLTSPYISELAGQGLLFTNMYANSSYTCASLASLITSTYPFDYSEYFEFSTPAILSTKRTLLSEVLQKHGFANGFFHDNPYLSPIFGYDRGFATIRDFGARKEETLIERSIIRRAFADRNRNIRKFLSMVNRFWLFYRKWYKNNRALNTDAEMILKTACEWVEHVKAPFFVWCHLMDAHTPYSPQHQALDSIGFSKKKAFLLIYKHWGMKLPLKTSELHSFKKLYDLQIRAIDNALKKYLPTLASENFDETYVLITADHGEEFMENGIIGHVRPLGKLLLHVPLIIYGGGVEHRVENMRASLIDLAPTIMDLVGLEKFKGFKGRSLLKLDKDRAVIAQGIFQEKRLQRVVSE